ncbi:response regulator transcription factor [Winogradskyella sp.]|uniref:response regulator transcription factor n=1 Tax=Winogradskyella sp. TaxID=1883156 RepID=UPI003BAB806E
MNRVLLVEDDKSFGYVLSEYLLLKNFQVVWEETVSAALKALSKHAFDIAILDVNLKNGSGYDVASEIKDKRYDIPFIFLTARDLKIDQLKGYRYGAEEYVTKPIDEEILLAKIQAVLSRQTNHDKHQQTLEFKTLILDKSKRELKVDSTSIQLTERESLLLEMLISRSEKLVERKEILQRLWENQDEFSRNSMDVYISRLRKYLTEANISIRNVHGKGFVLE